MGFMSEENIRKESLTAVAGRMLTAARTAPKGRGVDNLTAGYIFREDIEKVAAEMKALVEKGEAPGFFKRDADCILKSDIVVLMGTGISPLGINCGLCGFKTCSEKDEHPGIPCSFNTGDLGIAIGSAVSVAMDARADNRIMYSVGTVAVNMGLMGPDVKIAYGIPLSASGKNPFFDRKQG